MLIHFFQEGQETAKVQLASPSSRPSFCGLLACLRAPMDGTEAVAGVAKELPQQVRQTSKAQHQHSHDDYFRKMTILDYLMSRVFHRQEKQKDTQKEEEAEDKERERERERAWWRAEFRASSVWMATACCQVR